MADNISIKAAKLSKDGEHFDSGNWPACSEWGFLSQVESLVGRHDRTGQESREEAWLERKEGLSPTKAP